MNYLFSINALGYNALSENVGLVKNRISKKRVFFNSDLWPGEVFGPEDGKNLPSA